MTVHIEKNKMICQEDPKLTIKYYKLILIQVLVADKGRKYAKQLFFNHIATKQNLK